VTGKHLLWLLLALPAIPMVWPVMSGSEPWRHAIRPSGAFSAQLLLVALAITPLRQLLPASRWVKWLAARRRNLGVAAFAYASIHLVFFLASIGRVDYVVQGLAFASMWTGWLAMVLLLPLALTSNDLAMRTLRRGWKMLHRLAYPAALLVLAHWLLLTAGPWEALAWFLPLALLQGARIVRHMGGTKGKQGSRP
jgi:sulfoxide reductase heme-binding subunit YedZ